MFMALFTAGYFILFLPIIDQAFRGAPIGPTTNTFIVIAWVVAFIVSVGLGNFTAKKGQGWQPNLNKKPPEREVFWVFTHPSRLCLPGQRKAPLVQRGDRPPQAVRGDCKARQIHSA